VPNAKLHSPASSYEPPPQPYESAVSLIRLFYDCTVGAARPMRFRIRTTDIHNRSIQPVTHHQGYDHCYCLRS
jgi:hypothetical protein